jgi:hypothetical protein
VPGRESGGDQILFVGVAQEKTRVWRTARRRDPATGKPYPWLYQEQAMAGHWYFYGFDADFGPYADRLVMPRVVGEYSAEQPLRRRWWPVDRHNLAEVRVS